MEIDELSGIVVDECIALHRELGPGLFENVYEAVLAGRLEKRGLSVLRQLPVPVEIDGQIFDPAFVSIFWWRAGSFSKSRQSSVSLRRISANC
jgi:hypothetical protein